MLRMCIVYCMHGVEGMCRRAERDVQREKEWVVCTGEVQGVEEWVMCAGEVQAVEGWVVCAGEVQGVEEWVVCAGEVLVWRNG